MPKTTPCPCPVECRILSISGTQAVGILFIFEAFQAAAAAPSTSFLFIITNYEFYFLSFSIYLAQQFAQQSPQKLPSFQFLSNLPNLYLILSRHSITLSTICYPTPGILFPDKNIQKYTPIPSPTCTHKSLIFPSKIPKNGLKSLFFNR